MKRAKTSLSLLLVFTILLTGMFSLSTTVYGDDVVVPNFSFEETPDLVNWTVEKSAALTNPVVDTAKYSQGAKSLKIVDAASNTYCNVDSDFISIEDGAIYTVTVDYHQEGRTAGYPAVVLMPYKQGAAIGGGKSQSGASTDHSGNTFVSIENTIMISDTYAGADQLKIRFNTPSNYIGTIWFDNVRLTKTVPVIVEEVEITTPEQFMAIEDGDLGEYKLMNDIILPNTYTPKSFGGDFDGNGYKITVDITGSSDNTYVKGSGTGLFSTLFGAGTVYNLTIAGTITGTNLVGSVAGLMLDSENTVDNIINEANITGSGSNVGGIIGAVRSVAVTPKAVTNCVNKGIVTATDIAGSFTGGIAGHSARPIDNCANLGNVIGNTHVGGISGQLNAGTTTQPHITKSYNAARVEGMQYVGGIAGSSQNKLYEISGCYNAGKVIATGIAADGSFLPSDKIYAGAISAGGVHHNTNETGIKVTNCYNAGEALGGTVLNNLLSYNGTVGGVEAGASNALVSRSIIINHNPDSFQPSYFRTTSTSTGIVGLRTATQLSGNTDILGSTTTNPVTLDSNLFEYVQSNPYPYPTIKGNTQTDTTPYITPTATVPLENFKTTPKDSAVILEWENNASANHDKVGIYVKKTKVLSGTASSASGANGRGDDLYFDLVARISSSQTSYEVTGLENGVEYEFMIWALNDYKQPHQTTPVLENPYPTVKETPIKQETVTVTKNGDGALSPEAGEHVITSGETFDITATPNGGNMLQSIILNGVPFCYNRTEPLSYQTPSLIMDTSLIFNFAPVSADPVVITTEPYYAELTGDEYTEFGIADTEDPSFIVFSAVSEGTSGYTLDSYGMVFSKADGDFNLDTSECQMIPAGNKNTFGQYGVLFYGENLETETNYYVRPYAIYKKESSPDIEVYGSVKTVLAGVPES